MDVDGGVTTAAADAAVQFTIIANFKATYLALFLHRRYLNMRKTNLSIKEPQLSILPCMKPLS